MSGEQKTPESEHPGRKKRKYRKRKRRRRHSPKGLDVGEKERIYLFLIILLAGVAFFGLIGWGLWRLIQYLLEGYTRYR